MHKAKRMLCLLLITAFTINGWTVFSAISSCKIIDVSFAEIFVENSPNTMKITIGSLEYSGDFTISVYDGGEERQKIYEGTGHVDSYDWGTETYGNTVISVPIMGRSRGIAIYDIFLTPNNGSTVRNTVSFRVFNGSEITSGLLISDKFDNYTQVKEQLKQKGTSLVLSVNPTPNQVHGADIVLIGTSSIDKLPDAVLSAMNGKSLLAFKDNSISDKTNSFLSNLKSSLRYLNDSNEIRTQEYGNCINYEIVSTDLDKDIQIKNLFFHINNASSVYATKEIGRTEEVVKIGHSTDGTNLNALMVELLSDSSKLAVVGGDFLSDDEFSFNSENMYEQLFAQSVYDSAYLRKYSNYNVASNLFDWMLPQSVYKDMDIIDVKSGNTQGQYVSVTGTVVTQSEAIDSNNTAFSNYIYVQDATGGIRVFGISDDVTYSYEKWKINIKGVVSSYGGEREIVVFDQKKDLSIVSRKDNAFEPMTLTASQANESQLGNFVTITGTVTGTTQNTLRLKDESGEVSVFVDSYIGSTRGDWGLGTYDPRIEYGCTVSVIGIVSRQNGENVIRIYDTAYILLTKDKNGNSVETPPLNAGKRIKSGEGLVEFPYSDTKVIALGNEKKEITDYMQLLIDLKLTTIEEIPGKNLPVGQVFFRIMERCGLYANNKGSSVTVNNAAVLLLNALGYDYFIKMDKTQETLLFQQTKILYGIKSDLNSPLTAENAAKMIFNVFETPYFGPVKYGTDGANTYGKLDKCILDNLNLTVIDGTITETHYTAVNSKLPKNFVRMQYTYKQSESGLNQTFSGQNSFITAIENIDDYIGLRIKAYILNDDDAENNITAVLRHSNNSIHRLPNEDYFEFTNGSVNYYDTNGKVQKLKISSDAKLYVNGILTNSEINGVTLTKPYERLNTLTYIYGWYTFIDNGKGEITTVMADVYQDYIVNGVDAMNFRIDDKLSYTPNSIYLDPTLNDSKLVYEKNTGETALFSDIEKGDVISVRASKTDGKNILWGKIVIIKGSIKGKISSVNKSDKILELNGQWYDYVEIDDLRQDDFLFNMGDEGKFFVNMKGVVIMKDLKSMPYINYAYVISYGYYTELSEQIPAMYAYLSNGQCRSYIFAKNVTVRDGGFQETFKRKVFADRYLKDSVTGDYTMNSNTLVNFQVNDADEISIISFAFTNSSGKNDKGRLTLDRKYNQGEFGSNLPSLDEVFTYDALTMSIGDAFLTTATVIFDISLNIGEKAENISDLKSRIKIIPVSRLEDGSSPNITLFDMGDGNECAAAVTTNVSRTVDACGNLFIVNNTSQTIIDNDIVTSVYGYENGKTKKLILAEDVVITDLLSMVESKLSTGDVILYDQSTGDMVKTISKVMNVANAKYYLPDVYGNGSLLLPRVNFYENKSNLKRVVRYYYGLVTEKHQNKALGKLVLSKNNTPYPGSLEDRLNFSNIIAADETTVYYRINQNGMELSSFSDVITSPAGNYTARNGDLALIKTVNNIASDVILISK